MFFRGATVRRFLVWLEYGLVEFFVLIVLFCLWVVGLFPGSWIPATVGLAVLFIVLRMSLGWWLGSLQEGLLSQAIKEGNATLVGLSLPGVALKVGSIFSYGAGMICSEPCIVWILLEGSDEERLPPWLIGERLETEALDRELREALTELQQETLALFYQVGWRRYWPMPKIGFESVARTSAGGGWFYFK